MLFAAPLGRTSREGMDAVGLNLPCPGDCNGGSAKPILCHPAILQSKMGIMAVLMLPLLLLGISGLLFIYQEASRLWSKSAVQNKVVVITDAISGLGKGKPASPLPRPVPISALKRPGGRMGWGLSVGREESTCL